MILRTHLLLTRLDPGPDAALQGRFSASEDLVIRARSKGSSAGAESDDRPRGRRQGGVYVDVIIVEGRVEGDLHAEASITARPKANVRGNLEARVI